MSSVQPMPRIRLQQAGGSDLDAVMEVMHSAFDPSFGEAWTRAQCAGILPMHGVRLTVAYAGAEPLGFSLVRQVADEAELLLLAVAPDAQGQGIGSGLIEDYADAARSNGSRRLHLEVRSGNRAVELYERHGFTIEGRRPKYYRGADGCLHDALTMVRKL